MYNLNKYLLCVSVIFNISITYSMENVSTLKNLATCAVIEQITNDFEFGKKLNDNALVPEELVNYIKSQIIAKNKAFLIENLYGIEKKFVCSQNPITAIDVNKTGAYALIGSNGTVALWDLKLGTSVKTFKENENTVTALAFEEEGSRIGIGYEDGTFCMIDIESGESIFKSNDHDLPIEYILFNTNILVTVDSYHMISRDKITGQAFSLLSRLGHGVFRDLEEGMPNRCKIFMINSRNELQGPIDTYPNSINRAALSFDDSKVLTAASETNEAKLWDARSSTLLKIFGDHIYPVFAVGFSRDSRKAFTVSADGRSLQVKIWDTESGNELKNLILNTNNVNVRLPGKIFAISENCCAILFCDQVIMLINLFDDAGASEFVHNIGLIGNTPYAIASLIEGDGALCNLGDFKRDSKQKIINFDGKICKRMKLWEYNDATFALFGLADGHCYLFEFLPELNIKQLSFILKHKKIYQLGRDISYDDIALAAKNIEMGDNNLNSKDKIRLLKALYKIYGFEIVSVL